MSAGAVGWCAEGIAGPLRLRGGSVICLRCFRAIVILDAELLKVEIPSVAAPAAEAHAVGLVQLAGGHVVALHEAILYTFHRQVQSPGLPVDGDLHIAAQRGWNAGPVHQRIGQVILHHGGVVDQIVQAQLVQAVIGFPLHILVKFDLEGILLAAHGSHRGKGCVSLGADAHIGDFLSIDGNAAFRIGFLGSGSDHAVPIRDFNINRVNGAGIEQPFIPHSDDALLTGCRLPRPDKCGQGQHDSERKAANPVDGFASGHIRHPM